ncbi:MAG: alpha/beta fold hydrolase [Okeania sp. SIO3B3]|nr:alpha/beta fold hydrolase [Okeania sp. SIO3B3]
MKSENDRAFVEIDGEILEIENNYEWVRYTVQWGDTLSQIALNTIGDADRYWDIANYNGISNPSDIQAGVEIWVPSNNSTGTTVGVTTGNNNNWEAYTVQPGDSLWAIAQRTTGDPDQYQNIARYNNLDPNAILPAGVPIWVPSNNSTGTTQLWSEPTGGSSETSNSSPFNTTPGGIVISNAVDVDDFVSRQVDIYPAIQLVQQDFPESYNVTFERINSPGYIENVDTWIVIHGWNNSAENVAELASAIEEYDDDNDRQVLTLDWSGMANTGLVNGRDNLHDAAIWIEAVAEAAVDQLNDWGFDPLRVNLAGHSLGAYVAYEISEQLGGVENLVALDPAVMTTTPFIGSTLGNYSIDGVNFSNYSQWSWGLHSSILGNENIARTADESFKIDFGWWTSPEESHGAVKQLWENMLGNPNGRISQYFGLEDMNEYGKPWSTSLDAAGFGSDWEAIIDAKDLYGFASENSYWVPETLTEPGLFPSFRITERLLAA